MALHINNQAVEQSVRTLSNATGESMTDAIGRAVEQRLQRVRSEHQVSKPSVEEALAFIASFNLKQINEDLTDDEVLGYGPDGIPEE